MQRITQAISIGIILLAFGCSTIRYKDFTYTRFLSDTKVGKLKATIAPDGTVTVEIEDLSAEERLTQTIQNFSELIKPTP